MSQHSNTIDLHGLALVEDEPIHSDTLREINESASTANVENTETTATNTANSHSQSPSLDPALFNVAQTVYRLLKHHVFAGNRGFKSVLISGDWGTGKTSVLGSLARQLSQAEQGKNSFPTKTIFFEAWKYEKEENLMFALLWKLFTSSENYAKARHKANSGVRSKIQQMFDYSLSVGSQASLKVGIKTMLDDRAALQKYRREQQSTPFLPDYVPTDKFLKGFADLLVELYPNRKVVILIDDLDRCSPESAMKLLDNMRQLIQGVSDQNCCFVVAMDKVTLQQAIRHKFSELSSYDSNRYLEKLFPLMLQLPAIQLSAQQFCQVPQAPLRETPQVIDAIFQAPYFQNARLFKRCMNQLWTYQLAQGSVSNASPLDKRGRLVAGSTISLVLVEWLAAINRWPELRQIIHKDDSYWDRIQGMFERRSESKTDEPTVDDAEINAFLVQPGIKSFLIQSHVFGSIFSETNLYRRVQAYAAAERDLRAVGI